VTDGYHKLQTVFQLLDYGDNLTFSSNPTGKITISPQIEGVAAENNLIVRAAKLLQAKAGCNSGCDIVVEKKIPMGAGLGGGSSNAATSISWT
jgi:4-diphosphocytidyl-2-C-methyl-D-erythritol kinase